MFNGGFSTFLAVIPLSLSKTYPFNIFFKCWFSLFLYGMLHSLVLLPIILSYIGPSSVISEEAVTPTDPDEELANMRKAEDKQ